MASGSEYGCKDLWGGQCSTKNNPCDNGECYPVTEDSHACQCRPGFVGSNCEQEAKWIEFKYPSSYIKFVPPFTYSKNTRNLETLFVMPVNGRSSGQVATVSAANSDVCLP